MADKTREDGWVDVPTSQTPEPGGWVDVPLGEKQPKPETTPPEGMPWSDVLSGAIKSAPGSFVEFGKSIVHPFLEPVQTATTLNNLAAGIAQKISNTPALAMVPLFAPLVAAGKISGKFSGGEEEKYADALVEHFKKRYGGIENAKSTFATDPVGFLSDASLVLTGGGTLAARAPGIIGRVGEAASTVGRAIDPLVASGRIVRGAGRVGTELIGGLGTHTGADALNVAYNAGRQGGESADAFRRSMQGQVTGREVVEHAEEGLRNMYRQRSMEYANAMTRTIEPDRSILNFNQIDRGLTRAENVATYGIRDIDPATAVVRNEMNRAINEWRMLTPSVYHTPMGFDAMKRELRSMAEGYEIGTPARRAADEIVRSVRNTIAEQAPAYVPIMRAYEEASDILSNINRTLSLNPNATIDTSLRKLQSVLRNNVNTSYGYRRELANYLVENGSPQLMEYLAGQMLQPVMPRGLGRLAGSIGAHMTALAAGTMATGPAGILPVAMMAPFSSPRAMGNLYYFSGALERYIDNTARALRLPPAEVAARVSRMVEEAEKQLEKEKPKARATGGSVLAKMANGGRPPLSTWTANDPLWRALTPYQKAAAMALMEADKRDPESAKNALGAMINRAARSKQDLGMHVSRPIYQPAIEATQQARLPSILKSPAFQQLTGWAERRAQGYEPDPVAGATHFITKDPRTMLKLEASDPKKYSSWRNWTKYTDERGDYQNVLKRDSSHAFLAPEGAYSVPYRGEEATQPVSAPSGQDRARLDALIADAEKRAGMDRLASDAGQPQNVQSLASSPEDRQALDRLVGSTIGPSEADKSQLNRYIQGLMTPEPQAPMPALQPVQLEAPSPIAPVTPYDAPRARGGRAEGGVLRRFKKSGATA